jgi:hypothetical protein
MDSYFIYYDQNNKAETDNLLIIHHKKLLGKV